MISIFMSTYNGSKFIEQQIQSIVEQDIGFNQIKLFIRDDQSTDNTFDIARKYSASYKNIVAYQGSNLGPAYSFWELVKNANMDSDYYAFSDQDDIWFPDKISSAISVVKDYDKPTLYYCNALYVDKYGKSLNELAIDKDNHLSVPSIMAGMTALGCTMLFNKAAMNLFKSAQLKGIEMHDRTCYLIAYLVGNVIYDKTPHIYYRQHENNVIGCREKRNYKRIIKRFKQSYFLWFKSNSHSAVIQAQDMLKNYNNMLRSDDKRYLEMISTYRHSFINRIKLLMDGNVRYNKSGARRSYRLRIILNLF